MNLFQPTLSLLTLIAAGTVNFFAVYFGGADPRPLVRIASTASGLLAILCFLITPGAFFRFLLFGDSFAATQLLICAAFSLTAVSFLLDIAIALRLRSNAP